MKDAEKIYVSEESASPLPEMAQRFLDFKLPQNDGHLYDITILEFSKKL